MLKKEIYRLIINPFFQISTICIIIFTLLICIYFSFNTSNEIINIETQGYIIKYDSIEDIEKYLNICLEDIENLDINSPHYDNNYKRLNYTKNIYNYLLNDYIPYDELVSYEAISLKPSSNIFSFHTQLISYLMILIFLYIIIINYCVFSCDFDSGSYKYLYTKNNRGKVILAKSIITFVTILACSTIICILVSIYAYLSFSNTKMNVIGLINEKIKIINFSYYMLFDSIGLIFFSSSMTLFLTGLFHIFKKTVYCFIVSFSYILIISLLVNISSNKIISSFLLLPIFSYFNNTIFTTIAYNLILSLLFVIGIFNLKQKDL